MCVCVCVCDLLGNTLQATLFLNDLLELIYFETVRWFHISRMFAYGLGDQSSILGRVTKDWKMVHDTALLNTQQYKVRIKGKVEQSRERSSALPYTLM